MSKSKNHYWLKLEEDFFEDETIRHIREQEKGDRYLLIYLTLCLKSLRTEGIVIRNLGNFLFPYDLRRLADMTGTDIDTIRSALDLFKSYGLIEILEDGAIHMLKIHECIGKETDSARRMRKKRAIQKTDR